jgi:hypothetical protein
MIGLPVGNLPAGEGGAGEEARIVDFIAALGRASGMHFNINVGIYVPKPHTPFERVPQIGGAEARLKLDYIRSRLKPLGHKVSIQDPLTSTLEGLLSRGDGRVGDLIKAAFDRGCRLDAWTDHCRKDVWEELLEARRDLAAEILAEKDPRDTLPWRFIDSGLSPSCLKREYEHSQIEEFTSPCIEKCTHPCGICKKDMKIVENTIHNDNLLYVNPDKDEERPGVQAKTGGPPPSVRRIIFSFAKEGRAVFLPHLSLTEVFSMALLRSDIPVLFTAGFNPLPRLEICAPLSLGIASEGEIAAIETEDFFDAAGFIARMNENLPQGLRILAADNYLIPGGEKKHSLSSRLWGFSYRGEDPAAPDYVPAVEEKQYRTRRTGAPGASLFGLRRLAVLALDPENPSQGQSFFTAFRKLYLSTN